MEKLFNLWIDVKQNVVLVYLLCTLVLYHLKLTAKLSIKLLVNNTDMRGTMLTIRSFVDFLFNMKTSIEKNLGNGFIVEFYNSLEWSFYDHVFELCEHGNLKKLPRIDVICSYNKVCWQFYLPGRRLYHLS